jgi:hypothetical protein
LGRQGKVSPLELVDAAIARIEAVNGTLNVVLKVPAWARNPGSSHGTRVEPAL